MNIPRVNPGDPIRPRASFHNALAALLENDRPIGRSSVLSPAGRDFYTPVIVKNPGVSFIPAGGVARATDSLIDPAENLRHFQGRPCLSVEAASVANASSTAVIATDRIEAGGVGLAAIAGVIQCRVNVTDAGHDFAKPSTSVAWQLDSDASEGFPIVYKETGTGEKWAILEVREVEPASSPVIPAIISSSTTTLQAWEFEYTLKRAETLTGESSDWTEGETLSPAYNTAERIGFTDFTEQAISNGVGVLAVEVDGVYYFTHAPIEGSCS